MRTRILYAFAAALAGEIIARISLFSRRDELHWFLASVILLIVFAQVFADARRDGFLFVFFSFPALAGIAVLYGMCSAQLFSAHDAMPMPIGHMSGHAHAHLVCLTSVFSLIARYFEKSARFSALEALSPLRDAGGGALAELTPGDVITVPRGGIAPVDGRLVSGETSVDVSALTGAVAQQKKTAGDTLYCGSVNCARTIEIKAICARPDSVYVRFFNAVSRAPAGKAIGFRRVFSMLPWVIVPLLAASFFGAAAQALPLAAHTAAMRAVSAAVAVSPSVFALLAPLADTIGFAALGRSGIVVNSPAAAARLARAARVTIDPSASVSDHGVIREGLAKTTEILQKMGYRLDSAEAEAVVFSGPPPFPAGAVRVGIGELCRMDIHSADVCLSYNKITHLLKTIYVCKKLRFLLSLAFLAAAAYTAAAITLAWLGFLSPVYAGLASVLCPLILLVSNYKAEKLFKVITFEKVIRLSSSRRNSTKV